MATSAFEDWVGRTESASDRITPGPAEALAATLDRSSAPGAEGDPLPPLWHWLYFLDKPPASALGPDGHARRGRFLPPVELPRRMWAASRVTFHRPLRLGEEATRTSRIKAVEDKQGHSGALTFVTVEHVIHGEGGLAISEETDLAYREAPRAGVAPSAGAASKPPAEPQWSRTHTADPVLLFRYSALTFNSHRIHYDYPFATEVEGYPGLVVHGPLILTLLVEALTAEHPDRDIATLTMRARQPLFHGVAFRVQGRLTEDGSRAELWSLNEQDGVTMEATAGLTA